MQNALVNINGKIFSSREAQVSVFDRGFLYGDSLYEVTRSYDGSFFALDEHLARLEKSAALCRMQIAASRTQMKKETDRTLEAFQKLHPDCEAYCRLIVTRGVGKIGFGLSSVLTPPQLIIILQPLELPSLAQYKKGMKLKVSRRLRNDRRALDPAMKSGNYLNSLLAYLEAQEENYEDALLCNSDGHITEGTTFNVFYIRNGIFATPPLDIGILEGITRDIVLKILQKETSLSEKCDSPKKGSMKPMRSFSPVRSKKYFPSPRSMGIRLDPKRTQVSLAHSHQNFKNFIKAVYERKNKIPTPPTTFV